MMKLFIGNKAYSSWSLRGWLACKLSSLPFEEVVVPLYDEAWEKRREGDEFAPSSGKVPILWDGDDIVVWDSLAIIEYLNEKTSGALFWPTIRRIYDPVPPSEPVAQDIFRMMQLWAQARARHGGEGEFLLGEFSAVDVMFAPVVTRFITYQLPVARFAQAYMQAIIAHPWMQEWIGGAQAEDWVIDKFEVPPQVA